MCSDLRENQLKIIISIIYVVIYEPHSNTNQQPLTYIYIHKKERRIQTEP